MGPQNGIMGDIDSSELPQTEISEEVLDEAKSMAKFSDSKEFQRIREHCEARINFYQSCLPDGRPVEGQVPKPEEWMTANAVIREFNLLLASYETAKVEVEKLAR